MSTRPVYGLVCAGGGAHGAYQVGLLKYIHEHFCEGDRSPFQVFVGTSCGNLNTSFYASRSYDARQSCLRLEELWLEFDVPAYHGSMLKNAILSFFRQWTGRHEDLAKCWALLSAKPIRDVTERGFLRGDLEKAFARESTLGVAISATELLSGRLCFFLEGPRAVAWNLFHSVGQIDRIGAPHIQASCTVPIALPPVKIGDHYFVDGGVGNRRPLTPAYGLGATRILSVATDKPHPKEMPKYPPDFKPSVGSLLAMLVGELSHDYAADQACMAELMNYFAGHLPEDVRGPTDTQPADTIIGDKIRPSAYRPVEVFSLVPSKRIRHTEIYEHELLDPDNPSAKTLFMFKKEFIEKLIGFGYEDGRARHADLAAFFDRDRPQDPSRFAEYVVFDQ